MTGVKRYSTDVVVEHFTILSERGPNADGEAGAPEPQAWNQRRRPAQQDPPQDRTPDYVDDDLPFS